MDVVLEFLPVVVVGGAMLLGLGAVMVLIDVTMSGWYRLAPRYRATESPVGTWYSRRGYVGHRIYWLALCADPDGLFVSVMMRPTIGHPPLLIPWSEIRITEAYDSFFTNRVEFEVGSPRPVKFDLPREVFEDEDVPRMLRVKAAG